MLYICRVNQLNNVIMAQTKNKTKSFISDFFENKKFRYDLTEENYPESKTDYYRSKDCRFMVCIINKPIEKKAPNLIVIDASIGGLAYDSTTPTTDNTAFQGRVSNENELKILSTMLGF